MTNILMVTFDDLNDWSSVLGGYAGAVYTPNLDRLAQGGSVFANAFSTTPLCNPSRSSALTGIGPLSSGVLGNDDLLFDHVDPAKTLPAILKNEGWTTITAGKVFHDLPAGIAAQLYDEVLVPQGTGESGEKLPGQVIYTAPTQDSGIYIGDPEDLVDVQITRAVSSYLENFVPDPTSPLFLSVGITRPHAPHIAPQAFFDLYPLEDIVLPEVLPDDLDDIPGFADYFGNAADFDRTRLAGEWPAFVQAYLAAVSFADWLLGQMLDALANSAIADDTMVVAWSDHGYHLGEKQHAGKYTLWEEAARSTLIIDPPGDNATSGETLEVPVSLLDLYPTLLDYAGVPIPAWAEGESLRDYIDTRDGASLRGHAVTSILGSHSIRTASWRYTVYEDRSEELYNLRSDPEEFVNLADNPEFALNKAALARRLDSQLDTQPFLQNRTDTPAVLDATGGERVLISGTDADTLIGGAGDNTFIIRSPNVTIVEAPGGGIDFVLARSAFTLPDNVEQVTFTPTAGPGGDSVIIGNDQANLMRIGLGRAEFRGAGGNDSLVGGDGDDTLAGNAGDDEVEGFGGDDTLDGGDGDDELRGGEGDDVYRVSGGNDVIAERADRGYDRIDLGAWGGLAGTRVTFRVEPDGTVSGMTIEQIGGTGRTLVTGVSGTLEVEALFDARGTMLLKPATVTGGNAGELFIGSGGDDGIDAREGNDRVLGGDGNDRLLGGGGDDTVAGGAGDDTVDGARGRDLASYADAAAAVTVSLVVRNGQPQNTGGAGTDRLFSIEGVIGGAFGDTLLGKKKGESFEGGAGSDTIDSGAGDDTLAGGADADLLRGGAGSDRFVFTAADAGPAADRIADFTAGDLIDLSSIDADPATARRDRLRYDLDGPQPSRSDIQVFADGTTTRIEVAIGGDVDALVILLDGQVALTSQSFLL